MTLTTGAFHKTQHHRALKSGKRVSLTHGSSRPICLLSKLLIRHLLVSQLAFCFALVTIVSLSLVDLSLTCLLSLGLVHLYPFPRLFQWSSISFKSILCCYLRVSVNINMNSLPFRWDVHLHIFFGTLSIDPHSYH